MRFHGGSRVVAVRERSDLSELEAHIEPVAVAAIGYAAAAHSALTARSRGRLDAELPNANEIEQ
jgi:hypothetical protein